MPVTTAHYHAREMTPGRWAVLAGTNPVPMYLGTGWRTSMGEAEELAGEWNAALEPSNGARCPACGSHNTWNRRDKKNRTWVVCRDCGSESH